MSRRCHQTGADRRRPARRPLRRFRPAALAALAALAVTVAWSCSDGGDALGPAISSYLVTITPAAEEIEVAGTLQLSASVVDESDGQDVPDPELTWSSDDDAVATVDQTGLVTGVAIGDATITVDFDGNQDDAAVTVVAAAPTDLPPVAAFSVVATGAAGEGSAFDATASSDPEADALTYHWDFGDGGSGGSVTIGHIYVAAGSYTVTLTVTNASGLSDQATAPLTIAAAASPSASDGVVRGLVLDAAGEPLSDATVGVRGGGPSASTDAEGTFSVSGVDVGVPVVFTISRAGHAVKRERVHIPIGTTDGYFEARLLARRPAGTLTDAELGGEITGHGGARIVLGENALVDGSGDLVSGAVDVWLTPVDVSGDEIDAFPGEFAGILPDGAPSLILSYGAAEFILEQGGDRLDLAPGARATIEIPVYTGGAAVGQAIELWALDPESGLWIQEGFGEVVAGASPTGLVMAAEIGHLSWWNIDKPSQRATPTTRSRGPNGKAWGYYYRAASAIEGEARWRGQGLIPEAGSESVFPAGFDTQVRGMTFDGSLVFDTLLTAALVAEGNIEFLLHDPEAATTSSIAYGDQVHAALAVGSMTSYTFDAAQDDLARIRAHAPSDSDMQGTFALLDPGGTVIATTDFQGNVQATVLETLDAGRYTIQISGQSNLESGAYVLTLDKAEEVEVLPETLSSGSSHSCGLTASGTGYCWGANSVGQLGDGTTSHSNTPTAVIVAEGVSFASISAGSGFTVGITTAGDTYAWGSNNYGQLGDGTTTNRATPVAVDVPAGVELQSVSAAGGYTVAVATSGAAYAWGLNQKGQLGDGTTTNRSEPVEVAMPDGVSFSAISGGNGHTLALSTTGEAFAWGHNYYGQAGDDTRVDRSTPVAVMMPEGITLASVSAGSYHSLGLSTTGDAFAWGWNEHGQLGDGSLQDRRRPVAVFMPAGGFLTAISAANRHSLAITTDGVAYSWGSNASGQLGDGTTTARRTPVAVMVPAGMDIYAISGGTAHSVALSTTGVAYGWGYNRYGQVGDATNADRLEPVEVAGGITFY